MGQQRLHGKGQWGVWGKGQQRLQRKGQQRLQGKGPQQTAAVEAARTAAGATEATVGAGTGGGATGAAGKGVTGTGARESAASVVAREGTAGARVGEGTAVASKAEGEAAAEAAGRAIARPIGAAGAAANAGKHTTGPAETAKGASSKAAAGGVGSGDIGATGEGEVSVVPTGVGTEEGDVIAIEKDEGEDVMHIDGPLAQYLTPDGEADPAPLQPHVEVPPLPPMPVHMLAEGPMEGLGETLRTEPHEGAPILTSRPPAHPPPGAPFPHPHPQVPVVSRGAAKALAFLAEPCSPTPTLLHGQPPSPSPTPDPTVAGGPPGEHAGATRAESPEGTPSLTSHPSPPLPSLLPSPPRAAHLCPHPQGLLRAPRGAARALAFLEEPCSPTPTNTQPPPTGPLPPPPPGPPPPGSTHISEVEASLRPNPSPTRYRHPNHPSRRTAPTRPPNRLPPSHHPPQAAETHPQGLAPQAHGSGGTRVEGPTGEATTEPTQTPLPPPFVPRSNLHTGPAPRPPPSTPPPGRVPHEWPRWAAITPHTQPARSVPTEGDVSRREGMHTEHPPPGEPPILPPTTPLAPQPPLPSQTGADNRVGRRRKNRGRGGRGSAHVLPPPSLPHQEPLPTPHPVEPLPGPTATARPPNPHSRPAPTPPQGHGSGPAHSPPFCPSLAVSPSQVAAAAIATGMEAVGLRDAPMEDATDSPSHPSHPFHVDDPLPQPMVIGEGQGGLLGQGPHPSSAQPASPTPPSTLPALLLSPTGRQVFETPEEVRAGISDLLAIHRPSSSPAAPTLPVPQDRTRTYAEVTRSVPSFIPPATQPGASLPTPMETDRVLRPCHAHLEGVAPPPVQPVAQEVTSSRDEASAPTETPPPGVAEPSLEPHPAEGQEHTTVHTSGSPPRPPSPASTPVPARGPALSCATPPLSSLTPPPHGAGESSPPLIPGDPLGAQAAHGVPSTASSDAMAPIDPADTATSPDQVVSCPTCRSSFANRRALQHHIPFCHPADAARRAQAAHDTASIIPSLSQPRATGIQFTDAQWQTLDSVDWTEYFSPERIHARPLRRVPERVRGGYLNVLSAILVRIAQDPEAAGPTFLLAAAPTLFLVPATPPDRSHTAAIATRISRFGRGEWAELVSDALGRRTPLPRRTGHRSRTATDPSTADERRIARCLRLAACNETSRACAALESAEAAPDTQGTIQRLQSKHPNAERPTPAWQSGFQRSPLVLSVDHLRRAIFTAPRGSSGVPSGWVAEHLRDTFLAFPQSLHFLLAVYQQWLRGRCAPAARSLLASSTLVALAKSNMDVRPIAIGEVLVRILSRAVCLQLRDQMARVFLASQQFGVGVTCGTEVVVRGVRRALADHPDWVVLQPDVANAFNSFHRDRMFQALQASPEFQCLIPFIGLFYGTPSDLHYRSGTGVVTMHSERGTRQGDPLSPFLYALTQRLALEPVLVEGDVQLWSYADDTYVLGPPDRVLHHFTEIVRRLGEMGLAAQPHKCLVYQTESFLSRDLEAFTGLGIEVARRGLTVTGVPVGTVSFVEQSLPDRLERMGRVLPWLPRLRQPQTAARLLSACVSTRPQYLSRTVPHSPAVISSFTRWNARLGETFQQLLASGTWACCEDVREAALDQIFLPIRLGGFGIRRMARIAPVSFVCSWVQCAPILCSLPACGEVFRQSFASGEPEQIDRALQTALEGLPPDVLSLLPPWPSCASASPDSLFAGASRLLEAQALEAVRARHASPLHLARLTSLQGGGAGAWLTSVPYADPLRIPEALWQAASSSRLGLPIPQLALAGQCSCGQAIDDMMVPHHAVRCPRYGVATTIHDTVKYMLRDFAVEAGFAVKVEDSTLFTQLEAARARLLGQPVVGEGTRAEGPGEQRGEAGQPGGGGHWGQHQLRGQVERGTGGQRGRQGEQTGQDGEGRQHRQQQESQWRPRAQGAAPPGSASEVGQGREQQRADGGTGGAAGLGGEGQGVREAAGDGAGGLGGLGEGREGEGRGQVDGGEERGRETIGEEAPRDQTGQQPAQQQGPVGHTGRVGTASRIPDLTCRDVSQGLMVLVDVSIADPQREGNVQLRRATPTQIGVAAARRVQEKLRHWGPHLEGLQPAPHFYACVAETFGLLSEPLRQFLGLCAKRIAQRRRDRGGGDDGSARIFEAGLTTRLSVALQRAQAQCMIQHAVRQLGRSDDGWMPAPVPLVPFFYPSLLFLPPSSFPYHFFLLLHPSFLSFLSPFSYKIYIPHTPCPLMPSAPPAPTLRVPAPLPPLLTLPAPPRRFPPPAIRSSPPVRSPPLPSPPPSPPLLHASSFPSPTHSTPCPSSIRTLPLVSRPPMLGFSPPCPSPPFPAPHLPPLPAPPHSPPPCPWLPTSLPHLSPLRVLSFSPPCPSLLPALPLIFRPPHARFLPSPRLPFFLRASPLLPPCPRLPMPLSLASPLPAPRFFPPCPPSAPPLFSPHPLLLSSLPLISHTPALVSYHPCPSFPPFVRSASSLPAPPFLPPCPLLSPRYAPFSPSLLPSYHHQPIPTTSPPPTLQSPPPSLSLSLSFSHTHTHTHTPLPHPPPPTSSHSAPPCPFPTPSHAPHLPPPCNWFPPYGATLASLAPLLTLCPPLFRALSWPSPCPLLPLPLPPQLPCPPYTPSPIQPPPPSPGCPFPLCTPATVCGFQPPNGGAHGAFLRTGKPPRGPPTPLGRSVPPPPASLFPPSYFRIQRGLHLCILPCQALRGPNCGHPTPRRLSHPHPISTPPAPAPCAIQPPTPASLYLSLTPHCRSYPQPGSTPLAFAPCAVPSPTSVRLSAAPDRLSLPQPTSAPPVPAPGAFQHPTPTPPSLPLLQHPPYFLPPGARPSAVITLHQFPNSLCPLFPGPASYSAFTTAPPFGALSALPRDSGDGTHACQVERSPNSLATSHSQTRLLVKTLNPTSTPKHIEAGGGRARGELAANTAREGVSECVCEGAAEAAEDGAAKAAREGAMGVVGEGAAEVAEERAAEAAREGAAAAARERAAEAAREGAAGTVTLARQRAEAMETGGGATGAAGKGVTGTGARESAASVVAREGTAGARVGEGTAVASKAEGEAAAEAAGRAIARPVGAAGPAANAGKHTAGPAETAKGASSKAAAGGVGSGDIGATGEGEVSVVPTGVGTEEGDVIVIEEDEGEDVMHIDGPLAQYLTPDGEADPAPLQPHVEVPPLPPMPVHMLAEGPMEGLGETLRTEPHEGAPILTSHPPAHPPPGAPFPHPHPQVPVVSRGAAKALAFLAEPCSPTPTLLHGQPPSPSPTPDPTVAGGPPGEHAGATRAESPEGTPSLTSHPSPPLPSLLPSPPRAAHLCPHPQGLLRAPRGAARALAFLEEPCSPTPTNTQPPPTGPLPPPPPGPPPPGSTHISEVEASLRPNPSPTRYRHPNHPSRRTAPTRPPNRLPPSHHPPQAAETHPQGLAPQAHGSGGTRVEGPTGEATTEPTQTSLPPPFVPRSNLHTGPAPRPPPSTPPPGRVPHEWPRWAAITPHTQPARSVPTEGDASRREGMHTEHPPPGEPPILPPTTPLAPQPPLPSQTGADNQVGRRRKNRGRGGRGSAHVLPPPSLPHQEPLPTPHPVEPLPGPTATARPPNPHSRPAPAPPQGHGSGPAHSPPFCPSLAVSPSQVAAAAIATGMEAVGLRDAPMEDATDSPSHPSHPFHVDDPLPQPMVIGEGQGGLLGQGPHPSSAQPASPTPPSTLPALLLSPTGRQVFETPEEVRAGISDLLAIHRPSSSPAAPTLPVPQDRTRTYAEVTRSVPSFIPPATQPGASLPTPMETDQVLRPCHAHLEGVAPPPVQPVAQEVTSSRDEASAPTETPPPGVAEPSLEPHPAEGQEHTTVHTSGSPPRPPSPASTPVPARGPALSCATPPLSSLTPPPHGAGESSPPLIPGDPLGAQAAHGVPSTASSDATAPIDPADTATSPDQVVSCPTCRSSLANRRALQHHFPFCHPADAARRAQAAHDTASIIPSLSQPRATGIQFTDAQWQTLDSVDWTEYFSPERIHARPLRRVPERVRGGYLDVLSAILVRIAQDPEAAGPTFLLAAAPTLFLVPATPPDRSHTAAIATRISRFGRGEWAELVSNALGRRTPLPQRTGHRSRTATDPSTADERRIARCLRLAACNETSRACAALESAEAAPDTQGTIQRLQSKHPNAERPTPAWQSGFQGSPLVLSVDHLRRAIFTAPRGSSGGPSGWVAEHLRDTFLAFPQSLHFLLAVYQQWLRGRCAPAARSLLASSTLVALAKSNMDVRPIAIGEVLVRILSRAVCLQLRDQMARVFLASQQFGVGVTCGTEVVVRGVRRALADHPDWVVLQLDVANAFNSFHRDRMFQALQASLEFQCLIPFIGLFYGTPSDLHYRSGTGVVTMHSERGTRQGDPLSPFLYALTQRLALEPVLVEGDVQLWSYADDTYVLGPPDRVLHHFTEIVRRLGEMDLAAQPHKCLVYQTESFLSRDLEAFTGLGIEVARRGLTVTGVPVGTVSFVEQSLPDRLERMGRVLPWLPRLRQPQTAARLLSACVSTRPQYLSRTVPHSPAVISSFTRWNARLGETFQQLLASGTWACREDVREAALDQIFLPIRLGGFGIRRMARIAPVSFVCSWVQCAPILCSLPACGEVFRQSFASGEPEQIDRALQTALEGLPPDVLSLLPPWPSCASASPDSLFAGASRLLEAQALEAVRARHASPLHLARLTSLQGAGAGAWLTSVPYADPLRIPEALWQAASSSRLGLPIPQLALAGQCSCGQAIDDMTVPHHAVRCPPYGVATTIHDTVKYMLRDFAVEAGFAVKVEDSTLFTQLEAARVRLLGQPVVGEGTRAEGPGEQRGEAGQPGGGGHWGQHQLRGQVERGIGGQRGRQGEQTGQDGEGRQHRQQQESQWRPRAQGAAPPGSASEVGQGREQQRADGGTGGAAGLGGEGQGVKEAAGDGAGGSGGLGEGREGEGRGQVDGGEERGRETIGEEAPRDQTGQQPAQQQGPVGHTGRVGTASRIPDLTCHDVSQGLMVLVDVSIADPQREGNVQLRRATPTQIGVAAARRFPSSILPFSSYHPLLLPTTSSYSFILPSFPFFPPFPTKYTSHPLPPHAIRSPRPYPPRARSLATSFDPPCPPSPFPTARHSLLPARALPSFTFSSPLPSSAARLFLPLADPLHSLPLLNPHPAPRISPSYAWFLPSLPLAAFPRSPPPPSPCPPTLPPLVLGFLPPCLTFPPSVCSASPLPAPPSSPPCPSFSAPPPTPGFSPPRASLSFSVPLLCSLPAPACPCPCLWLLPSLPHVSSLPAPPSSLPAPPFLPPCPLLSPRYAPFSPSLLPSYHHQPIPTTSPPPTLQSPPPPLSL
ncbi:unnamed protein product [Closterium sp. NIES-65]|nr:unnamed protein product [Closterium sp. NIES-65]